MKHDFLTCYNDGQELYSVIANNTKHILARTLLKLSVKQYYVFSLNLNLTCTTLNILMYNLAYLSNNALYIVEWIILLVLDS